MHFSCSFNPLPGVSNAAAAIPDPGAVSEEPVLENVDTAVGVEAAEDVVEAPIIEDGVVPDVTDATTATENAFECPSCISNTCVICTVARPEVLLISVNYTGPFCFHRSCISLVDIWLSARLATSGNIFSCLHLSDSTGSWMLLSTPPTAVP